MPVTLDDVRELALSLPRSYEAVVRGRVKFRVGQIVYLAFSHDKETMGFGFPKELREALVQSEPHKFSLPSQSDMRFNWVHVRLAAIDADEMRDLVEGAWRCACRSASQRSTPPRGDIRSNAETPRRLASSPDRVPRLGSWCVALLSFPCARGGLRLSRGWAQLGPQLDQVAG